MAILELTADDFGQWGCHLILTNGQKIKKEKENTLFITNKHESLVINNPESEDNSKYDHKRKDVSSESRDATPNVKHIQTNSKSANPKRSFISTSFQSTSFEPNKDVLQHKRKISSNQFITKNFRRAENTHQQGKLDDITIDINDGIEEYDNNGDSQSNPLQSESAEVGDFDHVENNSYTSNEKGVSSGYSFKSKIGKFQESHIERPKQLETLKKIKLQRRKVGFEENLVNSVTDSNLYDERIHNDDYDPVFDEQYHAKRGKQKLVQKRNLHSIEDNEKCIHFKLSIIFLLVTHIYFFKAHLYQLKNNAKG